MPTTNLEIRRAIDQRYRDGHPDLMMARREYLKIWRARNRDRSTAAVRAWNRANHAIKISANRKWRNANPDKVRQYSVRQRDRLRKAIFDHYGWKCVTCGFDDERALTLDHINNDGAKERREMRSSSRLYLSVIQRGFPDTFQTLCMNCQLIKAKAARRAGWMV